MALLKNDLIVECDLALKNNLSKLSFQNDAFSIIRNLLYQYTSYNNSISLTTLPIYYLDVSTRISVYNKEHNINGDFIIKSIDVPLTIDGKMTIQASAVIEKQ